MTINITPNGTNFSSNIQFMLFLLVIILAAIVLGFVLIGIMYKKVIGAIIQNNPNALSENIKQIKKSKQGTQNFTDSYNRTSQDYISNDYISNNQRDSDFGLKSEQTALNV